MPHASPDSRRDRTPSPSDPALDDALSGLAGAPASQLLLHPDKCCHVAREWFRQLARTSAEAEDQAPRWLTRRWPWGPSAWPVAWCEVVRQPELDCGALAALAQEAFAAVGIPAYRIQLIEAHGLEQVEHWRARWARLPGAPRWIWGALTYHEAVGVLNDQSLRIWDPTDGSWREGALEDPRIRAVRLLEHQSNGDSAGNAVRRWQGIALTPGAWRRVP